MKKKILPLDSPSYACSDKNFFYFRPIIIKVQNGYIPDKNPDWKEHFSFKKIKYYIKRWYIK